MQQRAKAKAKAKTKTGGRFSYDDSAKNKSPAEKHALFGGLDENKGRG